VAHLLKLIEEQWICDGFPSAARVEAIADEVVAYAHRPA
jgi:hypothetical protein